MTNALVKKAGTYFIGNLASKALMAIIIPVYAFFVSPSGVGNYDYWLSLAQTATPVMFLAIWEAVLKLLISSRDEEYNSAATGTVVIFALIMYLVSILSMAVAVLLLGADCFMMSSIVLMSGSMGFLQIWQYFSRAYGKTRAFAFSGVFSSVVTFAFILILVCVLSLEEFGLVASYVAGQLAGLLYLESNIRLFRAETLSKFNGPMLTRMLRYSIPCVFNLIASTLMLSCGRMIIVSSFGVEANGLYAFALKFANIVTAVGSIFSMAVIEEGILRAGSKGFGEFYSQVSSSLLVLLLSLACVGLPAIALFYDTLGQSDYAPSFSLIPLSLIFAISSVMATQFGSIFMALGTTGNQAITTTFGLIASVVISLAFVDYLGVQGVMVGLSAGTVGMMALRFVLAKQMVLFKLELRRPLVLSCLYLSCAVVLLRADFGSTICCHVICLFVSAFVAVPLFVKSAKDINHIPNADREVSN